MKFKYYFRKSSFKKDLNSANILMSEIEKYKPLNVLEVGVFQGVTSRNICEKLKIIHGDNFSFTGIDLFEDTSKDLDKKEMTSKHNKLSNPLKHLLFNIILKKDLNSLDAVNSLLKKFGASIKLLKGLSEIQFTKFDLEKIDFVFLDGGHNYETVLNDLNCCKEVLENNGTILCDDYDLTFAPGVKKAIDKYVQENSYNCEIICNNRFAKIKKK